MRIMDLVGLESANLSPDESTIIFESIMVDQDESGDDHGTERVQVQLCLDSVRTRDIARLIEALALQLRVRHLR